MTRLLEEQKNQDKDQKPYSEYKKSRDETLELAALPNLFEKIRGSYSTTTELYDVLPKYMHDDVAKLRTADGLLKSLTRDFVFKKQKMSLKISPALVETDGGIEKAFYPSTREEIIEDVLRKFATDPDRNEFLDDRLSVRFSLYDLWKELRRIGHAYDYNQIKESLKILVKTNLEIITEDNRVTFSSNMFETLGIVDCNENMQFEYDEKYGKKVIYFIRFNSLVTKSIKERTWRILNYEQCMSYKKVIARWLHKRISNMFLNAKIEIPYNILLSTIIRDSGMTKYSSLRLNLAQVKKCLEEMIKVGSIDRYEIKTIFDEKKQNKIKDVKFLLYVSQSFYDDIRLNFLAKKDAQEIKHIRNKKSEKYNSIQESENNEETTIETDINNPIQSEITNILTYLNIPSKDINKILSSKKNQKNLEQVKNNVITAKNYIEKKQKNNEEKECNNTAIVLASIKNNWNNTNIEEETETEEDTKEDKTKDNLQKAKDYIKTIKDKTFKKISENLLKNFGPDIYLGWISNLKFVAIINSTLILSCTNSFIIDTIKKDYLYGVYRTEQDGSITWLRKGIKEVVEETEEGIKSVEIVKVEK